MHITDAHQRAAAAANRQVPQFDSATPEHEAWLRIYDREFAKAFVENFTMTDIDNLLAEFP